MLPSQSANKRATPHCDSLRVAGALPTEVVPREPSPVLGFLVSRKRPQAGRKKALFVGSRRKANLMAIAEELAALRERTLAEIAAADTSAALEAVRVAVLGKSGTLTGYLRSMGQVPAEERASVGKAVNAARVEVEEALAARKAALDAAELEAAMGEIGRAHV